LLLIDFPEPRVWARIVGKGLGVRYVQLVADLLNPFLLERIIQAQMDKIKKSVDKHGIKLDTTFISPLTRVNQLMHPDRTHRKLWFKSFFTISVKLGARGSGSHVDIMSVSDFNNLTRREFLIKGAIKYWRDVCHFGTKLGFEFLAFEPMSVPPRDGLYYRSDKETFAGG